MALRTDMQRLFWLVPLLAGALAFAVAPQGILVWDDEFVIRQQLVALHTLGDVFAPPPGIPHWSYSYYRPVTVLTYLFDANVFGVGATTGPHAMNVVMHLVATFFVWALARRLLASRAQGALAAMLGATLFAVHPIHTESISWLMGRSDALATMLLLPALLAALAWRDRGSAPALVASAALFLLAMLAKEVAIAGLLILPVVWLLAPRAGTDDRGLRPSRMAGIASLWVLAVIAYFALRPVGIGSVLAGTASTEAFVIRPLRALAWYLGKSVVPWPQTHFVVWELVPGGLVTAAVLALASLALVAAILRFRGAGDGVPLLGLLWLGLAIAPSLSATVPGIAESPVAERYLYLPSAGLAIAVAGALAALLAAGPLVARIALPATAAVLVAFAIGTYERGRVWLSDLALWTDATSRVTGYALPWIELGRALQANNDVDGAFRAFALARDLKASPQNRAVASYDMGTIYGQRGQIQEAARAFDDAIAADPTYARGWYGRGRILYQRALSREAGSDEARVRLLEEAEVAVDRALALAPSFVNAHIALGWALVMHGDLDAARGDRDAARMRWGAALDHLDRATALDPAVPTRQEAAQLRQLATLRLASR